MMFRQLQFSLKTKSFTQLSIIMTNYRGFCNESRLTRLITGGLQEKYSADHFTLEEEQSATQKSTLNRTSKRVSWNISGLQSAETGVIKVERARVVSRRMLCRPRSRVPDLQRNFCQSPVDSAFTVLSRGVRSLFGPTRKSSPWGNFSDSERNQSIKRRISL